MCFTQMCLSCFKELILIASVILKRINSMKKMLCFPSPSLETQGRIWMNNKNMLCAVFFNVSLLCCMKSKPNCLRQLKILCLNYPECVCFAVISCDGFILFFWYATSYYHMLSKGQFSNRHALLLNLPLVLTGPNIILE